ncbi:MAG: hypothetical protein AD742_04110 [Methylibium sp. NZG]|nr:MAG: hypothetical protein AD742_04110 [Methylibium sp. NZG]
MPVTPFSRTIAMAIVVSLGLMLMQAPLSVQARVVADLDELSDDELDEALDDELDDDDLEDCGLTDANAEVTTEQMLQIVMCALSDEGDDAAEQVITWAKLTREMQETNTTVQAVVWRAILQADDVASIRGRPTWGLAKVGAWGADIDLAAVGRDGRLAPPKTVVPYVKQEVRYAVASNRR